MSKLTAENLKRKSFGANEFLFSATARKLKINNTPNLGQLTCLVKVADKMQEIRDFVKKPISITSGFRCKELNKAVGGSPNSRHIQGLACDFNIKGLTPLQAVKLIQESQISQDKCFVERGCVHIQFCMNDEQNLNYFGNAERVNGKWVVTPLE